MVVRRRTLKAYGFYSIESYFDYILESEINSNYSQIKELFKGLSKEQKRLFFAYIQNYEGEIKNKFKLVTLY